MNRFSNHSDEITNSADNAGELNDSVTRRRFMTLFGSGVASLTLSACGAGTSEEEAETQTKQLAMLTVRGTTATTGATVASFQLSSVTGGTNLPFTIGHAFKKGQVPAGTYLAGSIGELQVISKNHWPDGSLKFAIVSGRATLVAGTPLTVNLIVSRQNTVSHLSTDNLRVTGVTASISAGAYGIVSWTSGDWGTPFATWISGPFMSSWLYRKQIGTDAHLVGWLEVRLYRGGAVEVLPWVENGHLNVANPTSKNANFTFTLGSQQRFNGVIDLPSQCRTVLVSGTVLSHWMGNAPQITANHDKVYLQSTGLVPTYMSKVTSTARVWSTLPNSFQPLQQGNYSISMGQTGYQPSIGVLPEWDVLYLTSDDPRAYQAVVMNAFSAGRYSIHFRDEKTRRPLRFSSYPNLVANGAGSGISGTGASTKNSYTPAASGTKAASWDIPHHPSIGFMAYLVTGRCYFMEETQFSATANYLTNGDTVRMFSGGVFQSGAGSNTTRGAAWALRTLAQAACITPDDDVLRSEFTSSLAANVEFYHSTYVAKKNNPFGIVAPYGNYTPGSGRFSEAAWMQDFFTAAVGYAIDLDPGMSTAVNSKLLAFFNWKAQSVIGRLGGTSASEYLYRDAAVYYLAVASSETPDFYNGAGPWYANWGEMYRATHGFANTEGEGNLRGAYFPDATSYWGNLMPAIAYAVRHNVAGAAVAYGRMTKAANWNSIVAGFNESPTWGVAPGGVVAVPPVAPPVQQQPAGIPAWVPPAGYFADVPMKNYPTDVVPAIYGSSPTNTGAMDSPFIMWGGSAVLRDYSTLGAQVYYAGGHESGVSQPNVQFSLVCDFSTLTWSVANVPRQANASGSFLNGYAADGTPYTPHSYLGLQEFPKVWGGGSKGSLISFFWAGSNYENRINVLDVSAASLGYSKLETRQLQNSDPSKIRFNPTSSGGNYPISVMDTARRGWWVAVNGPVQYTLFVSNVGDITQYPAMGGNLANGSMVLCNSLDLLVAIDGGYSAGPYAGNGYRSLYIRNLATGTITRATTSGNVPGLTGGYDGTPNSFHRPDVLGLQWVDELGCIVGLDEKVSPPQIVKLTPPASNQTNGVWAWSTVPVAHWDQDRSGQLTLQTCQNGVWSKFRWIPSLQAFVYATSRGRKPQVVKIA